MRTSLDCFSCFLEQALRAGRMWTDDEKQLKRLLDDVAEAREDADRDAAEAARREAEEEAKLEREALMAEIKTKVRSAREALDEGRYEEAAGVADEVLAIDPGN